VKPRWPGWVFGDVLCQLGHHPSTPLRGLNLAADVLAHLPVEIDERRIDGPVCSLASGRNEAGKPLQSPLHRAGQR
jgi:hypothetical protein